MENMWIVGMLSDKKEVKEIKDIAKICAIEERIHFLVRMEKIKELLRKEK